MINNLTFTFFPIKLFEKKIPKITLCQKNYPTKPVLSLNKPSLNLLFYPWQKNSRIWDIIFIFFLF